MDKVIEINNLKVTYKKEDDPILRDISFSVDKGKIFLILGESGSGKTTIINSIISNIQNGKIDGDIIINGKNIKNNNIFFKDVSYISQTFPLYEEETLYKNVYISYINSFSYLLEKYNLSIEDFSKEEIEKISKNINKAKQISKKISIKLGKEKKKSEFINNKIKKYFEIFGLDFDDLYNKKPSSVSGGQRQRIAMIKAVIREPSLIIMDEPFASLDKRNTLSIIEFIVKLKKEKNISFIISTHDFEDIDGYEDQCILLDKEQKNIGAEGTISSISNDITNKHSQYYFNDNVNEIEENYFNNKEKIFIKPSGLNISIKKIKNSNKVKLMEINKKRNNKLMFEFKDESKDKKMFVKLINTKNTDFLIGKDYFISLGKGDKND